MRTNGDLVRTPLTIFFLAALSFAPTADAGKFAGSSGSVQFFNEASLHKFEGKASSFTASLDTDSLTGSLIVQTSSMTTNLGPRDTKMHDDVLESKKYGTISFAVTGMAGDTEALKSGSGSGSVKLTGKLTIRDTSKTVTIPATYTAADGTVTMSGSYAFKWTDFNVPDPSIFISTLYPDMSVKFNVKMAAQ